MKPDIRISKFSTARVVAFEGEEATGMSRRAMGVISRGLLAAGATLCVGLTVLPPTAHAMPFPVTGEKTRMELSQSRDREALNAARVLQTQGIEACFRGAMHLKSGEKTYFYVKAVPCDPAQAAVTGPEAQGANLALGIPPEQTQGLSEASFLSLQKAWDFVDSANKSAAFGGKP